MSGLNKAILIGNVGKDPEIRYTQSGAAVLSLRLATSESFQKKGGEREEKTEWHSVSIWGKRAEGLNKCLAKGSRIYVEGRIQYRQWEDQDGAKRYATDIVASNVILLDESRGGTGKSQVSSQRSKRYETAPSIASQSRSGNRNHSDDQFVDERFFDDDSMPF